MGHNRHHLRRPATLGRPEPVFIAASCARQSAAVAASRQLLALLNNADRTLRDLAATEIHDPDQTGTSTCGSSGAGRRFVLCLDLYDRLFVVLARRAANGRLARHQWIGIRTGSTLRSDLGWVAGHRAALRLTPLFVVTNVVTCVALLAAALYVPTLGLVRLVGFGAVVAIIVLVVYSAYVGGKAAKSADAPTDDG